MVDFFFKFSPNIPACHHTGWVPWIQDTISLFPNHSLLTHFGFASLPFCSFPLHKFGSILSIYHAYMWTHTASFAPFQPSQTGYTLLPCTFACFLHVSLFLIVYSRKMVGSPLLMKWTKGEDKNFSPSLYISLYLTGLALHFCIFFLLKNS